MCEELRKVRILERDGRDAAAEELLCIVGDFDDGQTDLSFRNLNNLLTLGLSPFGRLLRNHDV